MVSKHVIAIVGGGPVNGNFIPGIAKGIPELGINAVDGPQFNEPVMYSYAGGTATSFPAEVTYLSKAKVPFSIITTNNASAAALNVGLYAAVKAAGGKIVATVPTASTQADWTPIVAAANPSKAKAVVLELGTGQSAAFMTASAKFGAKWKMVINGPPNASEQKAMTGQYGQLVDISNFPPLSSNSTSPLIHQFFADAAALAAKGNPDAASLATAPTEYAVNGWLGIYVIGLLAKEGKLKSVTAAGLTSALNGAKDINMQGVVPNWTPSAPGPKGLARIPNQSYWMIKWSPSKVPSLLYPNTVNIPDLLSGKITPPQGL
jgi:ABC-type branched-subunit amino acid transport system substrate-binding protein